MVLPVYICACSTLHLYDKLKDTDGSVGCSLEVIRSSIPEYAHFRHVLEFPCRSRRDLDCSTGECKREVEDRSTFMTAVSSSVSVTFSTPAVVSPAGLRHRANEPGMVT